MCVPNVAAGKLRQRVRTGQPCRGWGVLLGGLNVASLDVPNVEWLNTHVSCPCPGVLRSVPQFPQLKARSALPLCTEHFAGWGQPLTLSFPHQHLPDTGVRGRKGGQPPVFPQC